MDYEKYAEKSIYYSGGPAILQPDIKEILDKCRSKFGTVSVLDIGCGDGWFLNSIAQNTKEIKLYGTDISKTRLERTEEKLKDKAAGLFLYDASFTRINKRFEFINSDQVIEHVISDFDMVKNISNMLPSGGIFKVSSVYKKGFSWYFYRCNGKWVLDPTHIREYTSIDDFKKLFTDNGLKITSTEITPIYFSGIDFILRKFGVTKITENIDIIKRAINKIKIHKPGYYTIMVVGEKP